MVSLGLVTSLKNTGCARDKIELAELAWRGRPPLERQQKRQEPVQRLRAKTSAAAPLANWSSGETAQAEQGLNRSSSFNGKAIHG
jgi:hypothetical protein